MPDGNLVFLETSVTFEHPVQQTPASKKTSVPGIENFLRSVAGSVIAEDILSNAFLNRFLSWPRGWLVNQRHDPNGFLPSIKLAYQRQMTACHLDRCVLDSYSDKSQFVVLRVAMIVAVAFDGVEFR